MLRRLTAEARDLESTDYVDQRSDAINLDVDLVAMRKSKGIWRNDAGAGQEDAASREGVVAVQIFDQGRRIALQGVQCCRALEYGLGLASYVDADLG